LNMTYRNGCASEQAILFHLSRCGKNFIPHLGERVKLTCYAKKIVTKAERFEAWANDDLIGLLAVYCNSHDKKQAYITSLSVVIEWQGNGIASALLANCIRHVKQCGFEHIELEVSQNNKSAVELYKKYNFSFISEMGEQSRMQLKLDD
jgi:ribosomal protein S18 acetylase RimI-like enzyme